MTCINSPCPIFITCQKKDRSCPGSAVRSSIVQNGYKVMAAQEQRARMSAIDFKGDFG